VSLGVAVGVSVTVGVCVAVAVAVGPEQVPSQPPAPVSDWMQTVCPTPHMPAPPPEQSTESQHERTLARERAQAMAHTGPHDSVPVERQNGVAAPPVYASHTQHMACVRDGDARINRIANAPIVSAVPRPRVLLGIRRRPSAIQPLRGGRLAAEADNRDGVGPGLPLVIAIGFGADVQQGAAVIEIVIHAIGEIFGQPLAALAVAAGHPAADPHDARDSLLVVVVVVVIAIGPVLVIRHDAAP
jgi:hypothetical protein